MIQTLVSPWDSTFATLLDSVRESLVICSPYISRRPCVQVAKHLQTRGRERVIVHVLTDLSRDNLMSGSTDIGGLVLLCSSLPNASVRFLPHLHAKVYLADFCSAIVTSGNFTDGGLIRNREYGLLLKDEAIVSEIRTDIMGYCSIGLIVPLERLRQLETVIAELAEMNAHLQRS